jgi:hypothetical protein
VNRDQNRELKKTANFSGFQTKTGIFFEILLFWKKLFLSRWKIVQKVLNFYYVQETLKPNKKAKQVPVSKPKPGFLSNTTIIICQPISGCALVPFIYDTLNTVQLT